MDLTNPVATVTPGVHGRVLVVLARSGLPLTGKRVSELAGASVEQTRQVLHRMVEAGLARSQRAGQAVLFEMNREHLMWPAVQHLVEAADQAVWTIKRCISTTLEDVLDRDDAGRVTVALFGSVARGEAGPESDIDTLLITPDDFSEQENEAVVVDVIRAVETVTGNDCNVFHVSRTRFDELLRAQDPMVASWTVDAITFHGPDWRRRLTGASWDEPPTAQPRTTASEPRRRASTSR